MKEKNGINLDYDYKSEYGDGDIPNIDKNNTNPYRMWERAGKPEIEGELLSLLRKEGKLVPHKIQSGKEPIHLKLTANSTYLIIVE